MKFSKVLPFTLFMACTHSQDTAAPATPLDSARAQTPSERVTEKTTEGAPVVPAGSTVTVGPRLVATLDQAVGERVSKEGDTFTATVVAPKTGQPAIPAGTKIVGRVVKLYPSMTGHAGFVRVVVDGIKQGDDTQWFDGRVVGVELSESPPADRPVNATGAGSVEVVGSIIAEKNLPPEVDLKRDPVARGAAISLGTGGDQLHQLDKGTRMAIELRGPIVGEQQRVSGAEPLKLERLNDSMIGQEVDFASVPVESVIGDVVFWVGTDKAHRTLVVMDKMLDTPDSAIVVKAGGQVQLSAVVERMPRAEEAPRLWKLVTPAEASELPGHGYYLFAYRAKVVK